MPSFSLIQSLNDDLLLPWLDLYESAFPFAERVPVSVLLGFLKEQRGNFSMLAALDEDQRFAGLAFYMFPPEAGGRAAFLWYLATLPELRGQGLGAWMYRGILARLPRGTEGLYYDVEIPKLAPTREAADLARRRIAFYRRLGARRLAGILDHMRAADDRPPLELYLMVHPLSDLNPTAALALVRTFLYKELEETGEVDFE